MISWRRRCCLDGLQMQRSVGFCSQQQVSVCHKRRAASHTFSLGHQWNPMAVATNDAHQLQHGREDCWGQTTPKKEPQCHCRSCSSPRVWSRAVPTACTATGPIAPGTKSHCCLQLPWVFFSPSMNHLLKILQIDALPRPFTSLEAKIFILLRPCLRFSRAL